MNYYYTVCLGWGKFFGTKALQTTVNSPQQLHIHSLTTPIK